jgi:streptogramin lyase
VKMMVVLKSRGTWPSVVLVWLLLATSLPRLQGLDLQASHDVRLEGPGQAKMNPMAYNLTRPTAYPLGITTDGSGNVWFAEDNYDSISEFIPGNSTFMSYQIPTTHHLAWIWFLSFDDAGNLWFADNSQSLLWRFTPATRGFANYTADGAFPFALDYVAASGRMWFTSVTTNQVGYFLLNRSGASLGRVVALPGAFPGPGPSGIAVDRAGDAYVAETFEARIVELNWSTLSVVRTWQLSNGSQPVGLAMDEANHRLWFTNHASSFFGYVNLDTSQAHEFPTSLAFYQGSSTVTLPYWVGLDSTGNVWLDEHIGNRIARFDPRTLQLTEFPIPVNESSPLRFYIDSRSGVVWFTEFSGNAIGAVPVGSDDTQSVGTPGDSILLSPSATFNVNASPPEASPPGVSMTSSFTGAPEPYFRTSIIENGAGFGVKITAVGASPGNYTAAICFDYPNSNQCGYMVLVVAAPAPNTLVTGLVYLIVGIALVALLLGLRLESRRRGRRASLQAT